MEPLVSIITVNYNTTADTMEFIASCRALDYSNFEVIVVDNASASAFPDISGNNVKVIYSASNLGFAGGNNLGIEAASGEYIFFLNSDTLVPSTLLTDVVRFLRTTDNVGAVTPKILYADQETIQFAGSGRINPYTGRGKRIGRFEKDSGQHDCIRKTELIHGSAFILPRKVIDHVGKMPADFFLYYEEHDWAEQIKRAGYALYYFGQSHVVHKESRSVGKASALKIYYMTRNRLLFIRRNTQGFALLFSILFMFFVTFPIHTVRHLMKGNITQLKAMWKGFGWHLKNPLLKKVSA